MFTNYIDEIDNGWVVECKQYLRPISSMTEINGVCRTFHDEVNALLIDHVPLSDWVMRLGAHTDIENAIDTFNRQGLMYI